MGDRDIRAFRAPLEERAYCSIAAAVIGGAAITGIGSIVGGSIQAGSANKASDLQQQRYLQTRKDLAPFTQGGQGDFSAYNAMNPFNFNPTQAQLEQTPGYQFTLQQGLKAVQNSASARGLGVSGAAQKGAASYATGLASTTYQQQFQNALNQYMTNANKLLQGATIGENAGAQTGTVGANLAQTQAQAMVTAGGAMGGGISSAASGIGNALSNPLVMNALNPQTTGFVNPSPTTDLTGLY